MYLVNNPKGATFDFGRCILLPDRSVEGTSGIVLRLPLGLDNTLDGTLLFFNSEIVKLKEKDEEVS